MAAAAAYLGEVVVLLLGLEAAAGLVVLELGAVEEGAEDENEDDDGAGYDADHHGGHGPLVCAAAERVVVIGLVVAADALGHFCGGLGVLMIRSWVAWQGAFVPLLLWFMVGDFSWLGSV